MPSYRPDRVIHLECPKCHWSNAVSYDDDQYGHKRGYYCPHCDHVWHAPVAPLAAKK